MKKKLIAICVALVMVLCTLSLTACGLFSKAADIEVFIDGERYTYTVTKNSDFFYPPSSAMLKSGYYLDGFYDQQEGGTKYFTSDGKCFTDWQDDFPRTYYAQWKSVHGFTLCEQYEAPIHMFNCTAGPIGGSPYRLACSATGTAVNVIAGNLDSTIEVHLTFRAMIASSKYGNPSASLMIRLQDNSDKSYAEVFANQTVSLQYDTFVDYDLTFRCPAKVFAKANTTKPSRKMIIWFEATDNVQGRIKEINVSVKML